MLNQPINQAQNADISSKFFNLEKHLSAVDNDGEFL